MAETAKVMTIAMAMATEMATAMMPPPVNGKMMLMNMTAAIQK